MGPLIGVLGRYALGQVAANLPTLLTLVGTATGGLIDRLPVPKPVKMLAKGATAGVLITIAHAGSSPATPASSPVQAFLHKKAGTAHAK